MTREEARRIIATWLVPSGYIDGWFDEEDVEALRMAIEALQAQPTHGRLIDADALSKKLCGTTIFIKDGEVFQRMINDAPTVQADRPHGEWTPVTEQLPKIDETLPLCDQISDEVLGTDTYGNIRHVYLTNCGYLKPTFCTVEEGMSVDIVAWMALPEPYEPKTERRG